MILNDRFWVKVNDQTNSEIGCWEWLGRRAWNGYSIYALPRAVDPKCHTRGVHRLIYEALIGEIPKGLDLDHLCRNRGCINPMHLEPVTRKENLNRGARGSWRTHCKRGHEYTPENTFIVKGRNDPGRALERSRRHRGKLVPGRAEKIDGKTVWVPDLLEAKAA